MNRSDWLTFYGGKTLRESFEAINYRDAILMVEELVIDPVKAAFNAAFFRLCVRRVSRQHAVL